MAWPVLRAALDELLALPSPGLTVSFSGGEPTLEWGSIERAVDHVRAATSQAGAHRAVAYHVTTNGLRLGGRELGFIAIHDFKVDLSMDGAPPAQDLRGPGTSALLNEMMRRWRRDHPGHYRRRCRVAVTVTRGAIPHLADSIACLLRLEVPRILLQPAMGETPWDVHDLDTLDRQLARVREASSAHRVRTCAVPITAFHPGPRKRREGARTWGCAAPSGRALAVDVDGHVYPCVLAARSCQAFDDPWLDARMRCLSLGDIREGGLAGLRRPDQAAAASGIFGPKRGQHAGERRCARCRFRAGCFVCPIGRAWQAPPDDLDAVPEYLCAFNRLLQAHAARFLAEPRREDRGSDRLLRLVFSRRPPSRQS